MIYKQTTELYHHGIKGQKWGIRRFQNEDGTLTEAGKKRYGYNDQTGTMSEKGIKKYQKDNSNIKYRKQIANELINESISLDEKFDKTEKGSKLLKKYQDAIEKLYDLDEDDPKNYDFFYSSKPGSFHDIEQNYLYEQGKYTGSALLNKYGEGKFADIKLGSFGSKSPYSYKDAADLIQKYAKEQVYAHSM